MNATRYTPARRMVWLALLTPLSSMAQSAYPGWNMPYYGHMWGGGMGYGWLGWGHVLMWLGLIVLALLIYLLARRGADRHAPPHHPDPTFTALQILNERYARGEIDKAEYEEKKATLLASRR